MKLCVVADQSQWAASTRLLKSVFDFAGDIVVITPENATLWAESFLAMHSKNGAISGILVTNFSRLFQKMYPGKTLASTELESMVVAKAVRENKMDVFKKSSKKYGFSREAQKILSLAKESGVNLSLLETKDEDALSQKLRDLSVISRALDNLLPESVEDSSTKTKQILQKAKQGFFTGKTVCFVGFDDMNAGALLLVEEIIKTAKIVYVSAKEFDNNQTSNYSLCDEFLQVAKRINCSVEFDRKNSLVARSLQISKNLYAKTKISTDVDGVKIVRAKNRRDEVRFVADFVEQKIRQGFRYRDIEIVVPAFENYAYQIEEQFEKREIPVFVDAGKKIDQHALFVLVEKFLKLASRRGEVKNAVSLLKNSLLGANISDACVYQNFCDKHGIEFGDFKKDLSIGKDDPNFCVASSVHKTIQKIISILPKEKNTAKEISDAIVLFLSEFRVEQKLEEFKKRQNSLEEKEISDQVLQRFKTLLEEIQNVLGNCQTSLDEFFEIWQSGVSSSLLRLVPPVLDSVFVSNVSTSKHTDKPFVIVLGAVEGEFPVTVIDNGILTDLELEEIKSRFGLAIGPTTEHVNQIERCKVQEIFMHATNELVVCYPAFAGGEQKFVSSVVRALSQICQKNGEPLAETQIDKLSAFENYKLLEQRAQSVGGAKEVVTVLKSRSKSNKSMGALVEILGSAQKALQNKGLQTNIKQPDFSNSISVGKELFFPKETTSISQIEAFFACPYSHFAKYGLRVREREEASFKALDIGNFLHKCLERVTKKFMKAKGEISDAQFATIMKSVLAEIVKEEKYQAKVNTLQLEALKKEACRLCYAVLKGIERSGFKPVSAELRFGKGGELPAVSLDNTKVLLEGKIDRMDKCGNMVRLIDYKTGQVDLGLNNLYYGKKVQLFAYLLSVLEDKTLRPAGVFYLPIKSVFRKDSGVLDAYKMQGYFSSSLDVALELDHDLSLETPKSSLVEMSLLANKENKLLGKKVLKAQTHILSEEELSGLASYAKKLISGAVKEMEDGQICRRPLDGPQTLPCEYCAFKSVCKIDEHPELLRTEKEKITSQEILGANDNGIHN